MFFLGNRRLRDEGTDAGIVFLTRQLGQMLLGHAEIVPQRTQLFADLAQFALNLGIRA